MANVRRRAVLGLATLMAVGAGALVTPAAANAAAEDSATLTVGSLVLAPTERGYAGTLEVTVQNTGTEPAYFGVTFVEPIAGSWQGLVVEDACASGWTADGRRIIGCGVAKTLQPGEQGRVDAAFRVLSKTRKYAMEAPGGEVRVNYNDGTPGPVAQFSTLLRSTTGSVADPRPFVQDTQSNITLKVGKAVKLKKDADGLFRGRLPITVTWRGNTPHNEVFLNLLNLPDGYWPEGTVPDSGGCFMGGCPVPGREFMPGETRTFELIVSAPEDAVVGSSATGTVTAGITWNYQRVSDVDPTDNTRTFTIKIVG